jgi:hypothetical protein
MVQNNLIMIGKTITHFIVLEILGEGSMGIVYQTRAELKRMVGYIDK